MLKSSSRNVGGLIRPRMTGTWSHGEAATVGASALPPVPAKAYVVPATAPLVASAPPTARPPALRISRRDRGAMSGAGRSWAGRRASYTYTRRCVGGSRLIGPLRRRGPCLRRTLVSWPYGATAGDRLRHRWRTGDHASLGCAPEVGGTARPAGGQGKRLHGRHLDRVPRYTQRGADPVLPEPATAVPHRVAEQQLRRGAPEGAGALWLRGDGRPHRVLARGRHVQARSADLRADLRPPRGTARRGDLP